MMLLLSSEECDRGEVWGGLFGGRLDRIRVRLEGYLSCGIQWCVTPGTPPFSSWKVPLLWETAGNTQSRFVQREKQLVGERDRGEGSSP